MSGLNSPGEAIALQSEAGDATAGPQAGSLVTAVRGPAARYIGASVHRKEDRRLLTGHGLYTADVVLPGMLHAAFLRSTVAKGTVTSVDTSAARQAEGVVAVYTWPDFEGRFGEAWHAMLGEQLQVPPPLAIGDVRHAGDPLALVIAESRYLAEDGCDLIEVDIEATPAYVDYRTAAADTDRLVHAAWGLPSNLMVDVPFTPLSPDLSDVFASARHDISVTVEQNRYLCVPMETRGIIASWTPGREELEIVCATQSVHETRNFFARYLRIPEGRIRVQARDVGGGFGQKMFVFREECAVVLASRLLGRPVKWIEDRNENLIAASHSRNELGTVRLAVGEDLTIEAISIEHVADVGAYPPCPAVMDTMLLPGPYRIPRLGFSTRMVWTNTMGKAAYRGPWMFETTAREMAIDHAARVMGIDPIELRRRNLLSNPELPFTSPGGNVFKEITPLETLEQALDVLGYEAFRAEQTRARQEGRLLGLGCSVYVEPSSMKAPALATEGATVRVESSGQVVAYLGTTSHGQSIETTMAQIVADTIGVDYEDVTIVQGQSDSTPYGPGTGGSRTAVIAGGAILRASEVVRAKVTEIAAHLLEAAPADLTIESSRVFVHGTPSRAVTLKEVAAAAYVRAEELPPDLGAGLEATERFRPTDFPTWSNATHLCLVEVDPDTCIAKVLRYIVSEDCGVMINPNVVEGQISGGVAQGVGGVLLENFVYDADGNPLTGTFVDYLLPTTTDIPEIEISHIETVSSTNPGGYKGLGEGGAIGSHAAVANAVGDALAHLGVHVTRTPLGPNDIHQLLVEAGRA
jgi:aerobic carbon-monoxide dehydrogenase large subunit